jgi:fucose 4-O-acetylase-like acetyltransferase
VIMKLGTVMLIMAAAYVWTEYGVKNSWSWVRQLGTTSLLVYWVHIELVYGRWFGAWKENLSTPQVVAAAISLIVSMVLLSVVRSKWRNLRLPASFAPLQSYSPRRVSGD